jgi:hypothetical protein
VDHLTESLEALRARAMAWLADGQARVLAVTADHELADGARVLLASLEWAPDNRRAFFDLGGAGWGARADELRARYEAQREAFQRAGHALPELPPPLAGAEPIAAFARDLGAVMRAFVRPDIGTRGVMVLLSPGAAVEARALAATPGLEEVRWIWLAPAAEDAAAPSASAPAAAGATDPHVWTAACRIDRAAQQRESDELLAAAIAAVAAGAGGPPGGARPKMAPPPHPGDPGGARRSDAPAAATPAAPPHLHPMLLGIQALRAADAELAMQRFREARAAAAAAGAAAEAVETEILLATTGAQLARERRLAFPPVAPLFDAAAERAEAAGLPAAAAKARFLLGVCASAAGEVEIAARALLAAAELAKAGGATVLCFHALRTAADLAARAGLRARAAELGREALDVARAMDPREASATGVTACAEEIERTLRAPAPPHPGGRPSRAEDVSP